MNRTLNNLLIFAVGAAAGSAVAYVLTKNKYERIAQEEINDIRKMYQERLDNLKEAEETVKENLDALQRASDSARECLSKIDKMADTVGEPVKRNRPLLIDYSEFGEDEDYEKVTLMYYKDKVLATDDTDEIIEDADERVGLENLKAFDGQYEEDAIYIRNDERKTYYEILESLNSYDEIIARSRYAED